MAPPPTPQKPLQPDQVIFHLRRLFVFMSLLWLLAENHGEKEPEAPAPFIEDQAPPCWWTDTNPQPPTQPRPAQRLPVKPFEGQAKPPCGGRPDYVREVNGGCWKLLAATPPCPDDTYWHSDGRCYEPVRAARRLPTSVEP